MSEALTVIQTDHGEVKLSPQTVRKYLVSGQGNVSDQEVTMFLALCKYQKLNPFLREAYLIKFGNEAATIVTGKEVFTKRASKIEKCAGWNAGVVTIDKDNKVVKRPGTLVLPNETLIGGWCTVYRHDWTQPMENEVSLSEYIRCKKDGTPMSNWKNMPGTMIRKVAIVQALRDAFPEDFQGMYDSAEMPVDATRLEDKPVDVKPEPEFEDVTNEKIDAIKVTTVKSLLKETHSDEAQFCKYYGIDNVESMTNGIFIRSMNALSGKKSKQQSEPTLDI
jgi:phage recombination protein Bet